jgi:hypothetical protein
LIEILLRLLKFAFECEDKAALRIGRGQQGALHLPGFDDSRTARHTLVGGACRPEAKLPRVGGLRRFRRRLGRPFRLCDTRPQHGACDRERGRDVVDREQMPAIAARRPAWLGFQSRDLLHGRIPLARGRRVVGVVPRVCAYKSPTKFPLLRKTRS